MLFVGFTVIGGFVAWLMPWVFIPHMAAAAWGAGWLRPTRRARSPASRTGAARGRGSRS
ncbi:hypothetical protein [Nocardioides humi]|uniref:hypothetical protein n=1 Tax=Nocardioides humi TaxID=449461 RepID=UPI0015E84F08